MSENAFRRILVATDGSAPANAAIDAAASLARMSPTSSVRVVHVLNLEVHHRHTASDLALRREADRLLADAVARLYTEGVEAGSELVRADDHHGAAAVAEVAREFEADLVVVGSRGLSNWQSFTHRSVSHQLLTALDCPVLIVKGNTATSVEQPKRVLLAVAGAGDMGPGAKAAAAAANSPGSKVLVIHVLQGAVTEHGASYVEPSARANITIDDAIQLLARAGIEAEGWVMRPGPVAEVISGAAARWAADIIVLGSARLGDLGAMLFDSVTHDLLRATELPVLVAERSSG